MEVTEQAFAKVNLTLEITGLRADGYHLLRSVMQSVSLFDRVTVSPADRITVRCDDGAVPQDESNLAHRAARVFLENTAGAPRGARIAIEKAIPMQAGLAGGSADAAAVLRALNALCGGVHSLDALCGMGARVGADVPFCVRGGTLLAEGIGERLTPAPALPPCQILLAKPDVGVDTGKAFALLDEMGAAAPGGPRTSRMLTALAGGSLPRIGAAVYNVFERAIAIPAFEDLRRHMARWGAVGSAVTGSGSAVFGLFRVDDARALQCAQTLQEAYPKVFLVSPV